MILSISSRNTMPFCSTASTARDFMSSSLMSLAASSSESCLMASLIFNLRFLVFLPPIFWNRPCSWLVISSMPGGAMISTPIDAALTSISISLSSRSPSRSFLRNFWRVAFSGSIFTGSSKSPNSLLRAGGSRISRMRSSAASKARCSTLAISCSRIILIEMSTRSRMIDSTSRPT